MDKGCLLSNVCVRQSKGERERECSKVSWYSKGECVPKVCSKNVNLKDCIKEREWT